MTRQLTPPTGSPVGAIAHDHADAASLTIPDASLLFSAEFKRSGSDLVLVGSNGQKFIVFDYFRFEKRPDLVAGDGAVLSAKVVESLAVSNTPTQYAQATTPSSSAQVIGKVEKVTGSVTAIRNGVAVTLNVGDALNKTDIVQTGSNSNVGISLLDGTALNLSANTRMALNEFIFDVSASTGNAGHLTLVQGAFAFVSGLVASTGGLNIETPVANIGIRGTVGGATCSDAGRCEYYAGQEVTGPNAGQPSTFTLQAGGRYVNGQYVGGTAIASVTVGANAQVSATGVNAQPQVTFVPAAAADPGLTSLTQQLIISLPQFTPGPVGPQGPQAPQAPQSPQGPPSPNPQTGPSPGSSTPPPPDNGTLDNHPPLTSIPPITQPLVTTVNVTPPPDTTASSTSNVTTDAIILQTSTPPPPPSGTISTTISTDTGQAPTIASGGVTKDSTPTLSGSVSSGIVSVQIMDGPSNLGPATIDGSGSWSFTTTPLSDGPHAFTAVATDTDGNTANAGPVTAVIDTALPAAPVITTTAPPINNAPSIDIAGTAEPNSTVTLYNGASVVGTATVNGSGNWHIDGIALTGGATYNFTATATDQAGNTSDPSNALAFQENNAPAIQNVGGTETVAEDGSVLLQGDPIASVTDADGDTLTMTVSVAHGTLTASQAILDAITASALTAIDGNGSDGSLTVSGSASAITAAIQAGVTYAPATNFNGADTLDVEVTDGHATENASVAITVIPVNDAPQGANSTITTLEDTARTLPAIDFGFSDPNDGPANTLQAVKITTLPGAGTLTDNNVAVTAGQFVSLADINAGLLKFTPAANANGNGYASFTFQVQDNGGSANGGVDLDPTPNTITIHVTPVNDAPTVANAIADQNTTQGSAFSFQFALNTFNDVDVGDTLTYAATLDTNAPLPAWLSFNASTRTFLGTPQNSDVGTVAVKVTATDGALSVSDTFNIVVGNTNDAPVLNAGATPVLTAENEDAGVAVGAVGTLVSSLVNLNPPAGGLDNVSDADSGALTGIALTATNTANGTWFYSTNNGGSWTAVGAVADNSALLLAADAGTRLYFQSNVNFNGTVSNAITFRAWDQSSGTAGTKVDTAPNGGTTAFSAATDTANITINPVNDAPDTAAGSGSGNEDTTIAVSLSGSDIDGSVASFKITSLPVNGTLYADAGLIDTLLVGESVAASGNAATVYFKPNLNYNGSASFTYAAVDNNGAEDATPATASITVNPVNDPPTVANAIADQNATQGSLFSFAFAPNTFNDVDVGDTLTYTATLDTNAPLPSWLSFNAATRTFSGTPGAGDVGTIAVKVTATDGAIASVSDTFNIVVGNTNDAPVIQNVGGTVPVAEDASVLLQAPSALVTDADGDTLTMTVSVAHGTLTASQAILDAIAAHTLTGIDGDGSDGSLSVSGSASAITAAIQAGVTYAPAANYNGSDTLDVAISDGQATPHAPLNINVTPVNDAPMATGSATLAAINEDTASPPGATVNALFGGNFSDATDQVPGGSSANTFAGIAISSYTVDASKGAWQYSTNGGSSWTPLNSATTAAAITLNASDFLRFVPAANYNGAATALSANLIESGQSITSGATLDLTAATGGTAHSSAAVVALSETINAVNDAPDTAAGSGSGNEDTTIAVSLSGSDIDGSVAFFRITSLPVNGTLYADAGLIDTLLVGESVAASGNAAIVYFKPNLNYNGSASFTYAAVDNNGAEDATPATASITVNSVSDAPVVQVVDTLTRVSVPDNVIAGTVPGTDPLAIHAIAPDINGEGCYVVFFSTESVPTQGDNNDLVTGDIFLYDRLTNETKILTDTTHIPLGLRESGERFDGFAISGDGRFVVFNGTYTVNDQFGAHDVNKVYVYDRDLDQVTLLTDKTTHATITSDDNPQINGNGSLIALIRHDNTGLNHVSVYTRDGSLLTDITAAHPNIPVALDRFQNVAISNDGRYVTFWAYEQGIDFQPTGLATLFLFDRQTNSATVVGTTTAGDDLWAGSLSRDGHFIVFQSDQSLVGSDTNGKIDIYVYDTVAHTTQRVSTDSVGTLANDDSIRPSISADGRFVTFASNATNLGDTNGQPDTFVKDLQTGAIERVSIAVDGTQGNGDSSLASSISGGGVGTFIAFGSVASNLVPGDNNSASDVFVLDRSGGTAGQVTEDSSVTPAGTLTTHGSFTFSDVELTDAHTATVTSVNVSLSGGAPASFVVPGGLGTFTPTIVENTGDADPFGTLSWTFTVDNSALALLNSGQRVQQTYTVEINDGHGGVTTQDVVLTLVGITDQPTLTMGVLTPNGMFAPNDEPIDQMGSGAVQPGGTSTQFTIINAGANRKFVFDGYGFTFAPDATHAPTSGLITAIHEYTNDITPVPLINFSGVGVEAVAWHAAVVEAATNGPGGPNPLFDALTGSWAFNFVGGVGPDNFVGGNQNDTASGGDGDDFLLGSAGSDSLSGGNGNDTLAGGVGADQLDGGGGQDLAIYFHPTEGDANVVGPINVQLAAGTVTTVDNLDTLRSIERVVGTNSDDIFNATGFGANSINAGSIGIGPASDGTLNEFEGLGGIDTITGNGNTRISYLQATAGVTVLFSAAGTGTAAGDASVGTDNFTGVNRVRGSNFVDNFTGSSGNEIFEGRGADDSITGGGGFDTAVYGFEDAAINVQLAAGDVFGGVNTGHDTLHSVEAVSGTDFIDTYNAVGFSGSSSNAGSSDTFNRFEGRGSDDIITGNNNTQIDFANALAGITVTFGPVAGTGTSQGTALGDVADVGTDTFSGVIGVRGSDFADIIGPDAGNNIIDGRGGNDSFQGGLGDDSLTGGTGVDRAIYTDATGPITVNMAAATNNVTGAGIGNDTLSSVESIRGSAFNDSYVATGFAGASVFGSMSPTFNEFEGMAGDDNITGNSTTAISYLNAATGVTVNFTSWVFGQGASGTATGNVSVGNDTFTGVQIVRGSGFADTLHGSDNLAGPPELFEGRGGNDLIDGRGGFDRVMYEFRTDIIVTSGIAVNLAAGTVIGDASVGSDTLLSIESVRGTHFNDTYNATGFTTVPTIALPNAGSAGAINTGAALNEFEGLGGDDIITGNGNTRIAYINATSGVTVDLAFGTVTGDASVGHDTITGGVNSIIGSGFTDTLYGTSNSTLLTSEVFDGGAGNDTLVGRGGFDMAVYNANLGTGSGITVNMAAGTVIGDASIGTDSLSSIESIRGTNFVDNYNAVGFSGGSDDLPFGTTFNEFEGMGGNDIITGNGDTRISFVSATGGGVTVNLLAGTASGDSSVGFDTFTGVSRVLGSNSNDTITGDGNNNVIEGLFGNDILDGGGGNDTVSYQRAPGGPGNVGVTVDLSISGVQQNTVQAGLDTLSNFENVRGSSFNDTLTGNGNSLIEGGPGADHIIAFGGSDVASYEHAASGVTVNLANTALNTGEALGDTFTSINNVLGSNFSDHITGNSNANILDGGGGNGGDQLTGLGGADTFVFRSGFLTITDFNQGEGDLIDIRTLNGGAHIEDAQLDALIAASTGDQLDLGNGNVIEVTGIDLQTQLSAANFIHS